MLVTYCIQLTFEILLLFLQLLQNITFIIVAVLPANGVIFNVVIFYVD